MALFEESVVATTVAAAVVTIVQAANKACAFRDISRSQKIRMRLGGHYRARFGATAATIEPKSASRRHRPIERRGASKQTLSTEPLGLRTTSP
jgi:hypothetical protein